MDPERLKARLRRELLQKRAALERRTEKEEALLRAVLELPQYQKAQRLLCFVSAGSEPDTRRLLEAALGGGKEVYVPFCPPGEAPMSFYRIEGLDSLQPGRFGILEPDPARCPRLEPESQKEGLCIVPGLAFDLTGRRLGYGKGYYDRFLAEYPIETAGLCFRELVLERLPAEPHDQRVDLLVTEEGAVLCRQPGSGKEKDKRYE